MTSGFSGQTATVGAGGVPVNGGNGGAGGNSSFGGVTVNGGLGGSVGPVYANTVMPIGGAIGGAASGGNLLNIAGGFGNYAMYGSTNLAGYGGCSKFGPGPQGLTGYVTGPSATNYGAGGAGASVGPSTAGTAAGGAGKAGIIFIYEYS